LLLLRSEVDVSSGDGYDGLEIGRYGREDGAASDEKGGDADGAVFDCSVGEAERPSLFGAGLGVACPRMNPGPRNPCKA
jgi:hypothetical protein